MGEQLVINGAPTATLVDQLRGRVPHVPESAFLTRYMDAAQRAQARMRELGAESTHKAYWREWRRWGVHCSSLNVQPLPIEADALCSYLELLSEAQAPNTVRLALSALCALDRAHRVELGELGAKRGKLRLHPRVQSWLSAWSRAVRAHPETKAPALTVSQLDLLLERAAEPRRNLSPRQHCALYLRDRALVLLGICAALRVSEIAALQRADVVPDDRGLRVFIRSSKTDQRGEGEWIGVMPQARVARCPVEAHRAWITLRGDAPGPLYTPITRGGALEIGRGLCVRQLQELVSRRARDAGVPLVSAHSLRATFATLASARGKNLARIAEQGRWSSLSTLRGYMRQGNLFDDNASSGVLE